MFKDEILKESVFDDDENVGNKKSKKKRGEVLRGTHSFYGIHFLNY